MLVRTLRLSGQSADSLRRYEQRRVPRVGRVSRLSATEITNQPPGRLTRVLARGVPAALTGRAYLAQIRCWSRVLHDEQP